MIHIATKHYIAVGCSGGDTLGSKEETQGDNDDKLEVAETSLNAILGNSQPTTMKVLGLLNAAEVLILAGSPFGVHIGNGDVIRCNRVCRGLKVQVNDLKIVEDFHLFSIGVDGKRYKLQEISSGPKKSSTFQHLAMKPEILMTTPVLRLPDFSQPFILECDASLDGIGAILIQDNHPVAYFIKGFSTNGLKSAYDGELLALVLAIQKWSHYLLGRHFFVKTDHYTLKFLMEQRFTTTEQQRLLLKLLPYDFSIIHKSGKENRGVEGLKVDPYTSNIIDELQKDSSSLPDFSMVGCTLLFKGSVVIQDIPSLREKILFEAHCTPIADLPSQGGHATVCIGVVRNGGLMEVISTTILVINNHDFKRSSDLQFHLRFKHSRMNKLKSIIEMIQKEDFYTISQLAIVNNEDADEWIEDKIGCETNMNNLLEEDEIRDESIMDDMLKDNEIKYESEKHLHRDERLCTNIQVLSTYTNLEDIDLAIDDNWMVPYSECKFDFTRELGKDSLNDKEEYIRTIKPYSIRA
ncbi:hypothetical protein E3N88_25758 [Mikania micrantha]|uniref:Reverse transcriptase RNase H-like domain-containing protein n=1 Tax=Mikania micrantha TaxID=192012 RepID=A0A5N6N5M9_9ASTR|nr:hypothetical protein E3N88_25758 [Mikania micrantha]